MYVFVFVFFFYYYFVGECSRILDTLQKTFTCVPVVIPGMSVRNYFESRLFEYEWENYVLFLCFSPPRKPCMLNTKTQLSCRKSFFFFFWEKRNKS